MRSRSASRRWKAGWRRWRWRRARRRRPSAVQNLARAGDNIVSSTDLYGGTWNLFANTLKDQGIETRFVDPTDPEAFARATDDRTRAYYAETLPNPKLIPFPIAEVAAIGRNFGIPLIMDNTAAPMLVRPFDHGAAVVMYSTTKYIGGHGTSIGGVVIDGGNFDWEAHPARQPALNTPDPSYHGAVWAQAVKPLGPIAYILKHARDPAARPRRGDGPFNAFLFIQGIETLPLRMREHSENALRGRRNYLASRKDVTRVIHPAHHTGVAAERTAKYLPHGQGGLVGLRTRRRGGGGAEVHRRAEDVLPRGEYRRRAQPGDPSGQHDALAAFDGGTSGDRGHAGLRAAVGRDRAHRRHPRRPGQALDAAG